MNEYRGRNGAAISYELVETREWGANVAGVKLSYGTRTLSGFPKMAVRRTTLPGGSMGLAAINSLGINRNGARIDSEVV